jgi:hypothetical protein
MMKNKYFEKFLDGIDDYLYEQGWYINGRCIREQCKSFEEVEAYLSDHCFSKAESHEVVSKLRLSVMNEVEKDRVYDEGWNSYFNEILLDDNPYTDKELYDEWTNGWLLARWADEESMK